MDHMSIGSRAASSGISEEGTWVAHKKLRVSITLVRRGDLYETRAHRFSSILQASRHTRCDRLYIFTTLTWSSFAYFSEVTQEEGSIASQTE